MVTVFSYAQMLTGQGRIESRIRNVADMSVEEVFIVISVMNLFLVRLLDGSFEWCDKRVYKIYCVLLNYLTAL